MSPDSARNRETLSQAGCVAASAWKAASTTIRMTPDAQKTQMLGGVGSPTCFPPFQDLKKKPSFFADSPETVADFFTFG